MSKTVLITGASAGIGEATARQMAGEAYTVYAAARRLEKMEPLKKLGCIPLKMDITKEEDIQSVVKRIEKDQGGVDILINNAGYGLNGAVEEVSLEEARRQFDVNLFGLARLTQLVLPKMREKREGCIVNVSSAAGRTIGVLAAWYYATKHALEGWSDCLRYELRPFNIRVVIIEPGAIATEFADVAVNPMLERARGGPYAETAQKLTRALENMRESGNMSQPSVIADAILKAVKARNPKRRYVAGKYAGTILFVRRWLGDGMQERLLDRMLR